jgi:uncharacterized protein
MRKAKQEITDITVIEEILNSANVCRLGMCHQGFPYLVPMNYGYKDGSLYFHCAASGLKIDILNENDLVCFEVEANVDLVTGEVPCNWSQFYRSVIGWGRTEFIVDPGEKIKALHIFMHHYEQREWRIPDDRIERTTVFRVNIQKMTGKKDGN